MITRFHGTTRTTPFEMSSNDKPIPNTNRKQQQKHRPELQVAEFLIKAVSIVKTVRQNVIENFLNDNELIKQVQ